MLLVVIFRWKASNATATAAADAIDTTLVVSASSTVLHFLAICSSTSIVKDKIYVSNIYFVSPVSCMHMALQRIMRSCLRRTKNKDCVAKINNEISRQNRCYHCLCVVPCAFEA